MELAFIVGAVLGGLFGAFYMRHLMIDKAYKEGIEENRRVQQLLDEQYKFGIQKGEMNAKREMSKQNAIRDASLITASFKASHMNTIKEIDLPSDDEGSVRIVEYITTIVDNYIKCNNDMPFSDYVEYLLRSMFGVRGHS